jgi:hypothetical protein
VPIRHDSTSTDIILRCRLLSELIRRPILSNNILSDCSQLSVGRHRKYTDLVKHEALPMEQNGNPFSVPVYDRIFDLSDS